MKERNERNRMRKNNLREKKKIYKQGKRSRGAPSARVWKEWRRIRRELAETNDQSISQRIFFFSTTY